MVLVCERMERQGREQTHPHLWKPAGHLGQGGELARAALRQRIQPTADLVQQPALGQLRQIQARTPHGHGVAGAQQRLALGEFNKRSRERFHDWIISFCQHLSINACDMKYLPFTRYPNAITLRLDKYRADPARDAQRLTELNAQEQRYWRLVAERKGAQDARMLEFRWLLEELRVSFFAQELRTPQPVSVKRLEKAWGQLNH